MEILLYIILFLLGISIGSFLNVVADRIPAGKSIVSPPSHCFYCHHPLEARDLVPVLSYILLRGRCRYCGNKIPIRSLIVESSTGLLFVAALIFVGLNWYLLESLIYISIFIILIVTDLDYGVAPYRIVYPAIVLVTLISIIHAATGMRQDFLMAILGFAIGFVLFLLLWGISKIFEKNFMSFDKVVLAGLVGVSVWFPLIIISLCVAILTWGITALLMLILRIKRSTNKMSFGIYLAVGAIVVILCGKQLLDIYNLVIR
jgi:leader peptidase (prepilin peptidase) / N-methyltransferase